MPHSFSCFTCALVHVYLFVVPLSRGYPKVRPDAYTDEQGTLIGKAAFTFEWREHKRVVQTRKRALFRLK